MISQDDDVLLNASLDGELDAAMASVLLQRLAAEPELRLAHGRLAALRAVTSKHLRKDAASRSLKLRVAASASRVGTDPRKRSFPSDWRAMAATAVIAASLSSGLTYFAVAPDQRLTASAGMIAVHQHALLAADPVEVASSDRHTVKPWFDAKLALSPPVVDLATDGFALAGGRIDVIDGRRVPVMLYRHRAHLISVIAVPQPGSHDNGAPATQQSRDGYSVQTWLATDFALTAVGDISPSDLSDFVAKLRAAISTS